ncbi:hypothetical protein [Streptomyces gardneri]|uniref:hypothetical protein n=1 Tax=Streptomyces gardneri TaxID=66892 RepID=UPI0035D59B2C
MAHDIPTTDRRHALARSRVSSILNTADRWIEPETGVDIVNAVLDAFADQMAVMVCTNCETPVHWIDCPTGSWWAHETHPANGHDADPRPARAVKDEL